MTQIEGYDWAENRSKLERAITEVRDSGQEVKESAVLTVYRRLLGVVYEDRLPTTKEPTVKEPEDKKKKDKKEDKKK